MTVEVIKSFLVSLGFPMGGDGVKRVETALIGMAAQATKLDAAAQGAAHKVTAFTANLASVLDAGNEGSPRAEAMASVPKTAGQWRALAGMTANRVNRLMTLPVYLANQYAQTLGVDDKTLQAAGRGLGQFSTEYAAMAKVIGFNAEQAQASSDHFIRSFTSFSMMGSIMRDKIGANFISLLARSLDNLRQQILVVFPRVEQTINAVVKGLLWLSDVVARVIYRTVQAAGEMIDTWNGLDKSTRQVIAALGAMVVAWRLLNTAFALSPIGRIIALGAALASLLEDYVTWKEGGESLIDWSAWEPGIQYARNAITSLGGDMSQLFVNVTNLAHAVWDAVKALLKFIDIDTAGFNGKWLFDQIIESVRSAIKYVSALTDVLTKLVNGDFSGAWDSLKEAATILADSPLGQGAAAVAGGLYAKAADALNQHLPEWMGGAPVQRPIASKEGEQLLGWMGPMFTQLESLYQLPAGLLRSVATTESRGDQFAVSKAGAQGLFQFMPATAKDMGLNGRDVFDPMKSAQAAAKYLAQLLKANGGDLNKALASYNWGMGNVQKYGMALMPRETREYIPNVLSNMPGTTINQETHITVNGAADARATADAIASKQDGVISRTIQQANIGHR